MKKLNTALLTAYLIAAMAAPVWAVNQCNVSNEPFSTTGIDVGAGASQYNGLNYGLYGAQTTTGSNDMTAITGGTVHLSDGKLIAKGTGVSGGPAGVKDLCADGSTPTAGVCGDGSTPTIGVVSVGMSSLGRQWCWAATSTAHQTTGFYRSKCTQDSFLVAVEPAGVTQRFDNSGNPAFPTSVFASDVTWVNGAQEAQGLNQWSSTCNLTAADPACDILTTSSPWYILLNNYVPNYYVQDNAAKGAINVNQVQVVFLEDTFQQPGTLATFGALAGACATTNVAGGGGTEIIGCDMARQTAAMIRELKQHIFPNLQQVFLTSLYYEGYAKATTSPPPCGFENGFAFKEVVNAQIAQDNDANHAVTDAVVGDLCYETGRHSCPSGVTAPWVGWGPYIWANGITAANAYGVTYVQGAGGGTGFIKDYNSGDFTHPSQYGSLTTQSTTPPIGVSKYVFQLMHFLEDNASLSTGGDTTVGGTQLTCWAEGLCAGGVATPTPTPTAGPTPIARCANDPFCEFGSAGEIRLEPRPTPQVLSDGR